VFLPPLSSLQAFILAFDALIFIYYVYQCPCFERLKRRFAYYQYEFHAVEQQDCSSLFLKTLFVLLTKGLALGTLIAMQIMAKREIDRVYNEYIYQAESQADK
jgi:hypothetical protein